MNDAVEKVRKFYETFDFSKIITNSPKQIQDFLDKENEWIRNHLWIGKNVLEIGCGYGRLTEKIASLAKSIAGIDYSLPLIEKSRISLVALSNISLALMDATELGFAKNIFGSVVCFNASFSNMPGIEIKVLREMKRVCKNGGEVIFSVLSEKAKKAQLENYLRLGLKIINQDKNSITTKEGLVSCRFSRKDLEFLLNRMKMEYEIIEFCSIGYLVIAKKRSDYYITSAFFYLKYAVFY